MAKKTFNESVKELAEAMGHAVGKKANKRTRVAPVAIEAQEPPQEEDTSIGFTIIPSIPVATKDSITFPKGSTIVLSDGTEQTLTEDIDVRLNNVSRETRAGKDCYIWAGLDKETGTKIYLEASLDSASFTNFDKAVVIGGFHSLCEAVSNIPGHPFNDFAKGSIIPNSVWTVSHRPESDPEGMVWIPEIGKWCDIYLPSWDGDKLVSVYQGVIADGSSTKRFHFLNFAEYAGKVNKHLISYLEQAVIAKGSNERTNILGNADPNTTGGHYDSANRRMISNYGVEDCCGTMWICSRDRFEHWPKTTISSSGLSGYSFNDKAVYSSSYDTQKMGMACGLVRGPWLGGNYSNSSICGSRYAYCYGFLAFGHSFGSSRLLSSPKKSSPAATGILRD